MRPTASRLVVVLVSLNATLLLLLGLVLLRGGEFMPSALAQMPEPAPSSGRFVVTPAQLSANTWGCFVLDAANQTMCVYQYSAGEKLLKLQAARGVGQDTQLKSFNTAPAPAEVAALVETETRLQAQARQGPATRPGAPSELEKK